MKKNFKKLVLSKSTLTNLEKNEVNGGDIPTAITCNGNATCYSCGKMIKVTINQKDWYYKNYCPKTIIHA